MFVGNIPQSLTDEQDLVKFLNEVAFFDEDFTRSEGKLAFVWACAVIDVGDQMIIETPSLR